MNEIGTSIITIQTMMEFAVSYAVNFFTVNKFKEWEKAPTNAKIIPNEITSPKIKIAKIVTNIGVVKLIAVAWARGIKVNAENPANIPILTNIARQTNSPGLCILKEAKPELYIKGNNIIQAKRFLKKITSNIWIFSEDFLINMPMKLKKKIDIRI